MGSTRTVAMSEIYKFNDSIKRIKADKLSGSATLLHNYITAVNQLLSSNEDGNEVVSVLKNSFKVLDEHVQTFPVLNHFLTY